MKKTALLLVLMLIVCMVSAQNTTTLPQVYLDENGRPAIREKTVPMSEEQLEYSKGEWTPPGSRLA